MLCWPPSGARRERGWRRRAEQSAEKTRGRHRKPAGAPGWRSGHPGSARRPCDVSAQIPCPFLFGLFVFLLLSYRRSLHRLDTSPWLLMYFANIFS